jgi:dipeptidase E
MRLLLTSLGLTNDSIRTALTDLMAKPIGDASLVFVPTAMHAVAEGGRYLWEDIANQTQVGWRSASLLESSRRCVAFPSAIGCRRYRRLM